MGRPARRPRRTRGLEVVAALETALADAIAKAEPSVVAIAREKSENEETTADPGPQPPSQFDRARSAPTRVSFDYGSGVVIGDRGEILTAFHVVQGARRLEVRALVRQSVRRRDHRGRPAERPGRDRPPRDPGRRAAEAQADRHWATPTRLRKGSFLLALGNPFNAARRDGRPSASWGILANVARRLELVGRRAASEGPPAQQLSDPAPARRQAEPRHERRRRDQPQGGAGRPDHHQRQRGRASTPGRLRDPDGRAWAAARRDAQPGQGGANTACSASASTPSGTNRVRDAQPNTPGRRGGRAGRGRDHRRRRHPGPRRRLPDPGHQRPARRHAGHAQDPPPRRGPRADASSWRSSASRAR